MTRFSRTNNWILGSSLLSIIVICGLTPSLQAQLTTGTFLGTVKDESGAVIPGVTISTKHVATAVTRAMVSDDQGRYRIPELPVGDYELQAELSGFQTVVRSGIKLTIGREAMVDFTLKVGEISDKLTVTGEAPLVETTQATIAGLVDDKKIRDLPLNGRDIAQLAFLNEGVIQARNTGGTTQGGNSGVKVTIAGTRQHQSAFLVDGTDIRSNFGNTPAGASGLMLGVETIREFKVVTGAFSAEYGRFTGGVVTAVTKSGTNEIHGSAFAFHRNGLWDARNFFDRDPGNPAKRSNPPGFKRNQFGFNVGGPVVKNKTFYFGSYEAFRERLSTTSTGIVPTVAARQGILPTGTVTVDPKVRPYLALYPLPNGRDRGDGSAEYIFSSRRPINEDYIAIKFDHQISDNDSFFARYTIDDSDLRQTSGLGLTDIGRVYRIQYLTISEKKIFSPNLINDFRFGFTRFKNLETSFHNVSIDPSLHFLPNRPFLGSMAVPPLTGIGSSAARLVFPNLFQYLDDVSYARGAHSLKFGAAVSRFQSNESVQTRGFGVYSFSSLRDFLINNPRTFDGFITPLHFAGERQWLFGFYLQDDYKANAGLTINLGIRYEFITAPTEVAGRFANLDSLTQPVARVGNPFFRNPSLKNFAPRIGFAWDPQGNGKTSLRGGFGIFHDQVLPYVYDIAGASNPPWNTRVTIQAPLAQPSFPNPFERGVAGFNNAITAILPPRQPYIYQYALSLQREIAPSMVVLVGYQGSRGLHLPRIVDANQAIGQDQPDGRKFFAAGLPRRNSGFGQIRADLWDVSSFYNSFRLSVNRRFSQGLQFQVSYNYSRTVDDSSNAGIWDGSGQGSGAFGLDPDLARRDRGLSSWDIRHYFVTNYTYDVPFSRDLGWASKVFGGWQMNGIITAATGPALNIIQGSFDQARSLQFEISQRPDLGPGASASPIVSDGRDPNRYYDPTAFVLAPPGFFGNLGRNTLIGPGLATFDFSLTKNINIDEVRQVQFRSEFFNLFNRPNFGNPGQTLFSSAAGARLGTAGVITSTSTTSRQIQFGLRFVF